MASFRSAASHLLHLRSNQPPSTTTGMKTSTEELQQARNTDVSLMCLDSSGCQAGPARGSNVAVVSWWLAQISRKKAKRGTGGRGGLKSWRELKKEGYSYRRATGIKHWRIWEFSFFLWLHVLLPSIPLWVNSPFTVWSWGDQSGPCPLPFIFTLSFIPFLVCHGARVTLPPETHLLLISSMSGRGGAAWRRRAERVRAQEEEDASGRQQMPQSVSYFLSCETGHRRETAERSLGAWVCVKWRERKRKFERRMTWLHRTTSLSFIKARSFPLSVFFLSPECCSQAELSGYSGWCYSRCGVVEVSMLWPCYPGKRESIRGMPGEEETLSKTHFAPRLYHCCYLATNKEVHTQADAHVRRHLCTNVNPIRRVGKSPVTEERS